MAAKSKSDDPIKPGPQLWSLDEMKSFYATYAAKYDQDISTDTYPAPFLIGKWVLEHIQQHKHLVQSHQGQTLVNILDLGCGTGQSSLPFFASPTPSVSFKVVGADATPEMLEKAKKYPFDKLVCCNIEEPLVWDTSFHACVVVGVMDFVAQPLFFLSQVKSYLQASFPSVVGITFPLNGDMNAFSQDDLQQLAHSAGFRIIKNETILGYRDSENKNEVHYCAILLQMIQ